MDTSFDFRDRVALVTGGSRGLGQAICKELARLGAKVFMCGRRAVRVEEALKGFAQEGLDIRGVAADVSAAEDVQRLAAAVGEAYGRVDILVNNVGINMFTPTVLEAEEKVWQKIMATNLTAPFMVTKQVLPLMRQAGGGQIINISSVAARKAAPGMGIYCICKAGLDMLTRVLAQELACDHIRVNGIAPWVVRTEFSKPFWSNEPVLKDMLKAVPLGRIAEIEDVVGAVLFLASPLAGYMTGETILLDGGWLA